MSDEPKKLPPKLEATIHDSVSETFHSFEVLKANLEAQAKAEETYNVPLMAKIVFEKLAEYLIAERGWTLGELFDELRGLNP
jgi:hypothetical protein